MLPVEHSEDEEDEEDEPESILSDILILAPTGVYTGRVKHGIGMVIGQYADRKKQTRIRVLLVAGSDWVAPDPPNPTYKINFVDKLKADILATWKSQEHYDVECEEIELPFEAEEQVSGWMLKELCAFFAQGEARIAFIDTTAGTKEWLFAALYVVNFFPDVEVYSVKPSNPRKPADYSPEEVMDQGLSKLELTPLGGAVLSDWVKPKSRKNGKEETNDQYYLFKTIYILAREKAGSAPDALTKVWINIEKDAEYKRYIQILPKERVKRFHDESGGKKSISILLNAVAPYGLFEIKEKKKKQKSVQLTPRGAMLARELFKNAESESA